MGQVLCCPQSQNPPRNSKKARRAGKGAGTSEAVPGSAKQEFLNGKPPTIRAADQHGGTKHVKSPSIALSEIEWHECHEEFENGAAVGQDRSTPTHPLEDGTNHTASSTAGFDALDHDASDISEEPVATSKVGCMSIIDVVLRASQPEAPPEAVPRTRTHKRRTSYEARPAAGCSLAKRDMGLDWRDVRESYEDCDCTTFRIRGVDYMRTKLKVLSAPSFYRLAAADIFSFDTKESHVVRRMGRLPPVPEGYNPSFNIPPLIVINIMLPTYPPTFFGGGDGPGHSIVYYFVLRDDFDPDANPKALALLQRFAANGREADGTPTRERLKLIPRIVNVDEWCEKGPLTMAEHRLLVNYNEKPVLTRPQQYFFSGPNYLEIDVDIHIYTFLARKALHSFFPRLREVVWENAFVIQGNSSDELPEVVLGAARLYRTDFEVRRLFGEYIVERASQTGSVP